MFEKIIEQIERYDSIVLFGHSHPDGDCYGSQIGLKEVIKLRYPYKKVYAVGDGLPDFFSEISPMDEISDEVIKNSLVFILDANDLGRAGDSRIYLAKAYAKIDHHVDLFTFKEGPEVIVETANSTCELIVDLILENNWEINKKAANALFLGILTDTARFQYCVDFYKVFDYNRWLVSKGADPYMMYKKVNSRDEDHLKLIGHVYTHYQKTKGGTLYMVFDKETIHQFSEDAVAIANNVRLLGDVKGYGVWVFFVEREDGRMTVEFRSNEYNIQKVAASHGGGGHIHASGLTVPKFDKELIQTILDECDEVIKNGKEL